MYFIYVCFICAEIFEKMLSGGLEVPFSIFNQGRQNSFYGLFDRVWNSKHWGQINGSGKIVIGIVIFFTDS